MSLEELRLLIEYHNDLYYNQDNPELSDEEYDALQREYYKRVLIGEETVPGDVSDKLPKVKHLYAIKSLDKVNTEVDVARSINLFEEGDVTVKLDGLTVVVYGKGTLLPDRAVYATRGNGTEGEDVSHTCAKIPNFKAIDGLVYRSEVYMPKAELIRINKERVANGLEPFKNTRNAAAGMIRNDDPNKVQGLRYLAYRVLGSKERHTEQLELLKQCGVDVVPYVRFNKTTASKAVEFVTTYDDKFRKQLPMDIDGLVIQSDMYDSLNHYGETGHHPKDAVAYKFSSQGKWTVLKDVLWQVGRTGQISPVGVFDPVEILGSTITRATLHNIAYIRGIGLAIGSDIYVIKANDVIPRVSKVKTPEVHIEILEPAFCPVCRGHLIKENDTLFCNNMDCSAKIIAQIAHMASKDALNIVGLSTKTIEKMFDMGYIQTRYDIFKITADQVAKLDGFTIASATKLVNAINTARTVSFDKFLYATGIPKLGRRASKEISKKYILWLDFYNDMKTGNFNKIAAIDGIGAEICLSAKINADAIRNLATRCHIEYPTAAFINKPAVSYNFVITGPLSKTRNFYESLITTKGHTLQSSVTKSTSYLVTNETGNTTKLIKANQLGIPIISEADLLNMINK